MWSTPGLEVEPTAAEGGRVALRVREVPPGGGDVVFSRLAWPGYTTDGGGQISRPTDNYLLTIRVPEDAVGKTLTVEYSPPGWAVAKAAFAVGVGLALGWSLLLVVWKRRGAMRARQAAAERVSPSADEFGSIRNPDPITR